MNDRSDLKRTFLRAAQTSSHPNYDAGAVHLLLMDCVTNDAGNLLYVNAFLRNLRRIDATPSLSRKAAEQFRKLSLAISMRRKNWRKTLATAAAILKNSPRHYRSLCAMGIACQSQEHFDAAICYYHEAVAEEPDASPAKRLLAQSLSSRGQFDDALRWWRRVNEADGDADSQAAMEELSKVNSDPLASSKMESELRQAIESDPENLRAYLDFAEVLAEESRFAEADSVLLQAQHAVGFNTAIAEKSEELQLLQSGRRLEIARRRAEESDREPEWSLVEKLEDDHNRRELEVFASRAERCPDDLENRFQWAVRLKWLGVYAEALQIFEQLSGVGAAVKSGDSSTPNLDVLLRWRADLEAGECLQHLRRFSDALGRYQTAASSEDPELRQKALYRCGVLAMAMQESETAEKCLSELSKMNKNYRDVQQRLDKLREIRHTI